jgi:hypothetical protein
MTKISNNKAKIGKGQKVKLGSNDAYEVYQNPATGQLEIIDTKNNSRALVDKEDRGQIGGNGTFIKALKNGEPMADTGKTYSTVQGAVDAASSWVFVPPGTYNESVTIETEGLTLRGAGYDTLIDGGTSGSAIKVASSDITVSHLSVSTESGTGNSYHGIHSGSGADFNTIENVFVRDSDFDGFFLEHGSHHRILNCIFEFADSNGVRTRASSVIVSGCIVKDLGSESFADGIAVQGEDSIIANCIVKDVGSTALQLQASNCMVIGSRSINSGSTGVRVPSYVEDCIVANNRISNSSNSDISDSGSNTTLDGNLTGSAN